MKKFFVGIALLLFLILVSCKTESKTYKITYHLDNEGMTIEKQYGVNEVIPNIDILGSSKEGYELTAWYFDYNHTNIVSFPYTVTEDKDFWAEWTKLYSITLMYGSSTLKTEKVLAGKTFNNPGNPQIEGGGTFKGWSSDKDEYVEFDFSTRIEADIVLYAFFEQPTLETITVTFVDDKTLVETKEIQKNSTVSQAKAPIKTDYTFKGWSSNKDEYVEFDFETKLTENTTLYAFYTKNTEAPESVTITFKIGNDVIDTVSINKSTSVDSIPAPTKIGYTFKGWSSKENEFSEFDFTNKIEENISLYAFYDINTYTITYRCNNTVYTTQTQNYNSVAEAPNAPNVIGFTFVDWCIDEECTTSYDFSTKITDNITLYAKLEPVTTHTVTLIIDGKQSSIQINHNDTINQADLPIKEGYEIKAWYTDSNYTKNFDSATKITEDMTLYGKETIQSFVITFMNETIEFNTNKVNYNSTVTLPTSPSKTGYTFRGWSTKQNEFVEFNVNTKITSTLTLYAHFTINSYTVTFKNNETTLSTTSVNYNSTVTLPTSPSKTGYIFRGWSTKQNEFVEFNVNTKITSTLTLYAHFTINSYTVTFKNNETTLSTASVNYNSTITTFPVAPSKTGYTFKGWSTKQNEFVEFNVNTKITTNLNLYTFYEIQKFTVRFMDGTLELSSDIVDYNSTATFPVAPTKTGYTFKGWSTKQNEFVEFNTNTQITENATIYAYYVQVFTVTFNVDGTKTTNQVENGNKVAKPENPTKSGYTFTGWYLNASEFDFNTPITQNIELVAHFVDNQDMPIEIKNYGGYNEGLFFEATPVSGATLDNYKAYYKKATDSSWVSVDSALIREENDLIRCDVVGLEAGAYQAKLEVSGKSITITCQVEAYDRSGYAHFNYSTGVGAYNDDGTLKANAIVVYVTNENKNTVSITSGSKTYTGLVQILQNQSKINKPLDIRIIGRISTNQWKAKTNAPRLADDSNGDADFFNNELETIYGDNLVGLTVQYMDKKSQTSYKFLTTQTGLKSNGTGSSSKKTTTYNRDEYPSITGKTVYDDDSYFNMLDVELASNVTLEGVGTNAEFFQFGLTWKKCNSIEVRNLTFTDYTEDACSIEAGSNSDVNNYGNYWVHHNTFNRGKNNWDISGERDKYAGDGGIDLKYINSVTLSYNKFNNCKKTGLVGGSDSVYTKNVTFHHNYYYKVESRLPLGRQANMHIYNNYYEDCSTCQDIRANAFVFSEANYFKNCSYPQKVTTNDTYKYTTIKSFEDYYEDCGSSQATKASSRTQTLSGNCKPDGSTDYTNFDTNSSLFYYTGSASKVTILHTSSEVPDYCKTYSGVLKSTGSSGGGTITPDPDPDPTPDPQPSSKVVITFNELATGKISSSLTTSTGAVLQKGNSTKDIEIKEKSQTINDTTLTKYVSVAGGGNYTDLSISFTTTKKANITIYYANPGSSGNDRFIALYTQSGLVLQDTTGAAYGGSVVHYTYTNMAANSYAATSKGSGLNIYMIVIEYLE